MESLFTCPVCLDIPKREIYQCTNGHIICNICVQNLKNCPQCRKSYGVNKIRARVLEEVLANRLLACTFKGNGCTHRCKLVQGPTHAKSCLFNPDNVRLCEVVPELNKCIYNAQSRDDIISHLKETHHATHEVGTSFTICHANFKNIRTDTPYRTWSPVIFSTGETPKSPLFLGMARVDSKMGASWYFIQVCESKSKARKYTLEVFLHENPHSLKPVPYSYEYPTHVRLELKDSVVPNSKYLKVTDAMTLPISFVVDDNFVFPDGSIRVTVRFLQESTSNSMSEMNTVLKEVFVFLQPAVKDSELQAASVQLQRVEFFQRRILNRQMQNHGKLDERKRQLLLKQSYMTTYHPVLQKEMEENHRLQKQSLEKALRETELELESQLKIEDEEIMDKEKQMVQRHKLEREVLYKEKLAIQKHKEECIKILGKDAFQQLNKILEKHASEKLALDQNNLCMVSQTHHEVMLLNDQSLENQKTVQRMLEQQKQIETQMTALNEHIFQEQRRQQNKTEKQDQIEVQKKATEEQTLAKQLSEKEVMEAEMQEKLSKLKLEISSLELFMVDKN